MSQHYSFSPIKNFSELLKAIEYVHLSCYALCQKTFERVLPNAGNMGIFCHYPDEYQTLTRLRESLTEPSDDPQQKYFKLHQAIVFTAQNGVPETTYTHLYIRKPDPYRHHVGDVDFFLETDEYSALKASLLAHGEKQGMRIFERSDLDMIELYDPEVDALAYVSTEKMSTDVRVKIVLPK